MATWRGNRADRPEDPGSVPPGQGPGPAGLPDDDAQTRAMPVVPDDRAHGAGRPPYADPPHDPPYEPHPDPARDRFGGVNAGAAFFGWIVAVGTTVLLTGVLGVVYTVLGLSTRVNAMFSRTDLRLVETLGLVSAGLLLLVVLVAYFCGGYVAGRMSRFDGARQGVAVWGFALLFSLLAAVAGFVLGDRYDLRVDVPVPTLGLSATDLSLAGLAALGVLLLLTLGAAAAGGRLGIRYHAKVDRAR